QADEVVAAAALDRLRQAAVRELPGSGLERRVEVAALDPPELDDLRRAPRGGPLARHLLHCRAGGELGVPLTRGGRDGGGVAALAEDDDLLQPDGRRHHELPLLLAPDPPQLLLLEADLRLHLAADD